MKKTVLKCAIFIIILVVIMEILSFITLPKDNTVKAGVFNDDKNAVGIKGEKPYSIDVYVIGDSEAYSSYVPFEGWKDYGFTSFTHGVPAQPLVDCYFDFIDAMKNQNPKVVILETDTIYKWYNKSLPVNEAFYRIAPVTEYHNRWKSLNKSDFKNEFKNTYTNENKGYLLVKNQKNVKEKYMKNYMKASKKKEKMTGVNKYCLNKIKQYCDEHDIELIILSAPNVYTWNYKKHNAIQKWSDTNNVKYIDLNTYDMRKQINLDWKKDSRDEKAAHINYGGALKVTNYINAYLKENYNLPDHRQDPNYADWQEACDKFEAKVQNEK